jgi:ribonuclease VapC
MFVDASAIIAIIAREPDGDRLAAILGLAGQGITSSIAIFEAALGLRRKGQISQDMAELLLQDFLEATNIRVVAISPEAGYEALAAQARFGRGRGHPAKLNMGDCFAYAVAKAHNVPLLFTGNDFPHTDIEQAK